MKIRFLKDFTDERGRGFRAGDVVDDSSYTRLPFAGLVADGTAEAYPPVPKAKAKASKKKTKAPDPDTP